MGSYDVAAHILVPAHVAPDWIGYRASLANVWRRDLLGDVAVRCVGCRTETDVPVVVHSPRCTA